MEHIYFKKLLVFIFFKNFGTRMRWLFSRIEIGLLHKNTFLHDMNHMINNWMLSLAQTTKKIAGSSWRTMACLFNDLSHEQIDSRDFNLISHLTETWQ